MMCTAVFFLPCTIMRVTNFSTTGLLYRGSRTTFFFRISWPLGIVVPLYAFGRLAPYLERAFRRSSTPRVSLVPRMMW